MPFDPRLNCAAEICCTETPPTGSLTKSGDCGQDAHRARVAILVGLGVEEDLAHSVSRKMIEQGIVFLSVELARAIRHIAFPDS